jgi:hypothetical protein
MTLPAAAWLAALSIMATACKEKVSYEGPDLAGSRAAFGCDKSPSGDAADACRKGDRLYQLKPSKQAHCISELYRVK